MSIQINTAANAVNWETLLSSLGEVKKTDSVEGKTNFTITTRNGDEMVTTTVSIPDDLEIPENVDVGTLQELVDKLGSGDLGFTDEQIATMKDAIIKAYEKTANAVNDITANSSNKSSRNVMFNLYALMALIIDVAQSQRNAQREIRTSENLSIQKSYQNQADAQRDAANLGMWLGIGCGVASAAASFGVMAAQGVTASQQAKIVSQSGADSAKMHVTMLQNTDTPENAVAQLNSTTQKVGIDVASRIKQDFNTKLSGDGNNGDLKTILDGAISKNNAAKAEVEAKTANLAEQTELLSQRESVQAVAQNNVNAKSEAVNQKQGVVDQKQQAYDNEVNRVVENETQEAKTARINTAKAELDTAKTELETAKTELATARTQLDTANTAVTQQTAKVTTAQNDLNLANQKATTTETAVNQARSDYQKTVSEVASSYQDKYQNAVDRLANPPEGADMAQLKADVEAAKAEMEMAFAVEASMLSQNGVMTPTEQTNLVSSARAKADVATDSAYRRMDVKALDTRLSKLMTIGNVNQAMGGVLQSMVQNLSAVRSSDATRQSAETSKQEEMLDQTKDLFSMSEDVISKAIQLYQTVIQAENQSMRDAIQA